MERNSYLNRVIFVKKQELENGILARRLFSVCLKLSAINAFEIATRFVRNAEGTSISSAKTSLLGREAEGCIKSYYSYSYIVME